MKHFSWLVGVLAVAGTSLSAFAAEPLEPFEDCGELIQGVECILFDSDTFGVYVLQDLGGFGVGDYVLVAGDLDPDCFTTCQQGDGCIFDNTIEVCEDTPTEDVTWSEIKSWYR